MDDGWTGFIVLLLGDPHLLEGRERSQDGATDPDRVFPLWWSNDLDLHGWWCKRCDFFLHAISNTWVHCGATRQDCVGIQVLTNIHVAFHDGIVTRLVDSCTFHSQE